MNNDRLSVIEIEDYDDKSAEGMYPGPGIKQEVIRVEDVTQDAYDGNGDNLLDLVKRKDDYLHPFRG